jgi:hypothetical protein
MTLRDLFTYIGTNPSEVLFFFIGIPLVATLIGFFGKGEGSISPWKYVYSILIFGICIPGIFSVALSIYMFLFERGSIMNANVYTQILPVASMFLTLGIISRNVSFAQIPGFDRISSMMTMIAAVMVFMWFLDRTRIVAFSYIPIQTLLLILVGMVLVFRYGLKQLFR